MVHEEVQLVKQGKNHAELLSSEIPHGHIEGELQARRNRRRELAELRSPPLNSHRVASRDRFPLPVDLNFPLPVPVVILR